MININNNFVRFKTIITVNGEAPININHDVELDCADSAFFCALHALEGIKSMSYVLHEEEREDFYKFIKGNLHYGN